MGNSDPGTTRSDSAMDSAGAKSKVNFKYIQEDLIPFACYVDPFTILSKNGEVMQTIAIYNYKNSDNASGLFTSNIRKGVASMMKDCEGGELSFWIHNIKSRNLDILGELMADVRGKDAFSSVLQRRWKDYSASLNNYDTICYITILHPGTAIRLSLQNVPLFLDKKLLHSTVNRSLRNAALSLSKAVRVLAKSLSDYKLKRLKCYSRDDNYYSEHLRFFSRLINFDNIEYGLPIADLSSAISRSMFNFGFGTFHSLLGNRNRHGVILSLKDSQGITPDVITSIMNSGKDVITCEVFHSAKGRAVKNAYKEQIEIASSHVPDQGNEMVLGKMGIDVFADQGSDSSFVAYKQYVGFMLVAASEPNLETAIIEFAEALSDVGVITAKEDIGIERSFYSFLPGNFRFIRHASIVSQDDISKFAYSYIFDNDNIKSYTGQKSLFLLSTINSNAYAFGILKDKPDVVISGANSSDSTLLSNFIVANLSTCGDANLYSIDFANHSETLMRCFDGHNIVLSPSVNDSTGAVDLFYSGLEPEDKSAFFSDIMLSLSSVANISPDAIEKAADVVVPKIVEASSLGDIMGILSSSKIDSRIGGILTKWFSEGGELNHLLSIGSDRHDVEQVERRAYVLPGDLLRKLHDRDIITSIVLHNIFYRSRRSHHPSIIVIHNPFLISEGSISFQYLKYLIESDRTDGTCVIFVCGDADIAALDARIDFECLTQRCDTEFHMFGNKPDTKYGKIYNMQKHELFALKKMEKYHNAALLKQNGLILPVKVDFSFLGDIINSVLHDNLIFRERIAKCIKFFNDDKVSTWLSYFLDKEKEDAIDGVTMQDEDEFSVKRRKKVKSNHGKVSEDEEIAYQIIDSA